MDGASWSLHAENSAQLASASAPAPPRRRYGFTAAAVLRAAGHDTEMRGCTDDQRRKRKRQLDQINEVEYNNEKRSRFRSTLVPMSREEQERYQDRNPVDGRFSHALEDKWDRQCVARPIVDPAQAIADGKAMFERRIAASKERAGEVRDSRDKAAAEMAMFENRRAARIAGMDMEEALADGRQRDQIDDQETDDMWRGLVHAMDQVAVSSEAEQNIYTRRQLCTETQLKSDSYAGDKRMEAMRITLNSLGYTRSQFQKMFHNAFMRACLPLIYGADWEFCSVRVLKELGETCVRPEVMVQTPRRFGKTVSVAMFVAAVLLNCPGLRICVFSTGKRASSGIMTEIMDRLALVPGALERIVKNNQEQLFIAQYAVDKSASKNKAAITKEANASGVSRLFSFPAGTASKSPHQTRAGSHARASFFLSRGERAGLFFLLLYLYSFSRSPGEEVPHVGGSVPDLQAESLPVGQQQRLGIGTGSRQARLVVHAAAFDGVEGAPRVVAGVRVAPHVHVRKHLRLTCDDVDELHPVEELPASRARVYTGVALLGRLVVGHDVDPLYVLESEQCIGTDAANAAADEPVAPLFKVRQHAEQRVAGRRPFERRRQRGVCVDAQRAHHLDPEVRAVLLREGLHHLAALVCVAEPALGLPQPEAPALGQVDHSRTRRTGWARYHMRAQGY